MIISDKHKFVFIHIPKCAGTSVRGVIETFDSREGKYTGRVDHHPELGELDYVHIPLFALHDHFRPEFEAVQKYWSFAVMRDPYARFASSISQYLRKYNETPMQELQPEEIWGTIQRCIDILSRQPRNQQLLPPEYIHFQKQVDFIILNGNFVLDNIYTVNNINNLLNDIGLHVGESLVQSAQTDQSRPANRTIVFRNELLRRVIGKARPLSNRLSTVLPESIKQNLRDRLYVPRDQKLKYIFDNEYTQAFIRDYYAEDISLYEQVNHDVRSVS